MRLTCAHKTRCYGRMVKTLILALPSYVILSKLLNFLLYTVCLFFFNSQVGIIKISTTGLLWIIREWKHIKCLGQCLVLGNTQLVMLTRDAPLSRMVGQSRSNLVRYWKQIFRWQPNYHQILFIQKYLHTFWKHKIICIICMNVKVEILKCIPITQHWTKNLNVTNSFVSTCALLPIPSPCFTHTSQLSYLCSIA